MFSKFSEDAQKLLMHSKKEMKDLGHPYVGSEHLVLSLLKLNSEFSNKLSKFGVTYAKFKDKLISIVGESLSDNTWFIYTPLLKRIIETALLICKESSADEVLPEHLIYALFEEGDGVAIRIFDSFGIDVSEIQADYSYIITNKKKNSKKKLLVEEFGIDLTKKALKGELDPVTGRNNEIKRIMEILCRRTKNNPLLIGDAGVGKTALVEELARMIINNQVPDKLKNKKIISVSIASLVSGTKYRGEFEERITKMLKELEDNPDIFLFIDEIHTIMGAGGAEEAIDAANIFKPALSRGKIRLIGATTKDEYKTTIEKDRAMERRFQTVFIEEPNNQETLNILKTLKPIYEQYHNVRIDDSLLNNIISLSNKYMHDRYQPDKSIDVLDEVCSKAALDVSKNLSKLDIYKEELKSTKEAKNKYIMNQDYDNATKLKEKEKDLLTKINNLELKQTKKVIRQIKLNDIISVISTKTNIPIYGINTPSNKYINDLEKKLSKEIIGQDQAIKELVNITKRYRLGYKNDNKPISLLFVGPTGVGKTKLATLYSELVLGHNRIIRIDGSEYKEESSINKLLGSAPGYVGYDDNRNKLELIRNNPYSLILFDEIEKAHPSVLNLFLQILDEGSITDNKGNTLYFNNSIIIFTSNIGYSKGNIGFTEECNKYDSKLKDFLSVELLNRIKNVVYFNKMDYNNIYLILKNKLASVKQKFKNKNIKIHISDSMIKSMIDKTRYLEFGARKVNSVVEEMIDRNVIDNILDGKKEIYITN